MASAGSAHYQSLVPFAIAAGAASVEGVNVAGEGVAMAAHDPERSIT
jgi:hypothetical protein